MPITGSSTSPQQVHGVESRATPRYRVLQRCFVRPPEVHAPDGWRGVVFSMSAMGVGVSLPAAILPGTEIEIQPWKLPDAPTLKARVVRVHRLGVAWLTGCQLAHRLRDEELVAWLANVSI
jgi:hypothetical protein